MEFFRIKKDIPFMRYALVFNAISFITFALAVFFLFSRGLHLSVEFTGGTVMEVAYTQPADIGKVRETVSKLGYADVIVQNFGTSRDVMIRLPVQKGVTSAQQSEQVLTALKAEDAEVTLRRTEFVGPQVGDELMHNGLMALGFVVLGIFAFTVEGLTGATIQMVNHGLSTGALFLLVGMIYERRHTREISEYGGLSKVMPAFAGVFLVMTMSSIGLPTLNGFIGEFLVISGTFVSERIGVFGGIHTVGAAAGVILAAVYMLGVVQKMFFGPITNPKNKHLPDLTAREAIALTPLIVMIFIIGFFPGIFIDRMTDAIEMHHSQFKTVSGQAILYSDEKDAKLLPEDVFAPAFLDGSPSRAAKAEIQASNDATNGGGK